MKTNFPTLETLKKLGLTQKKIFQSIKKRDFLLKSINTKTNKKNKASSLFINKLFSSKFKDKENKNCQKIISPIIIE